MKIKVLGSGCKSCKKLYESVQKYVTENNVEADVEYITDLSIMIEYGIMVAPAMIIDEKVVSTGKELSTKEIKEVIEGNLTVKESSCSCNGNC